MSGFDPSQQNALFGFNLAQLAPGQQQQQQQQNVAGQQAQGQPSFQGFPQGLNPQQLRAAMAGMVAQGQAQGQNQMGGINISGLNAQPNVSGAQAAAAAAAQAAMGRNMAGPSVPQQQHAPPPPPPPPPQGMPNVAQLAQAIEQAKKGLLNNDQLTQLKALIARQQAIQQQQQQQQQPTQQQQQQVRQPGQPGFQQAVPQGNMGFHQQNQRPPAQPSGQAPHPQQGQTPVMQGMLSAGPAGQQARPPGAPGAGGQGFPMQQQGNPAGQMTPGGNVGATPTQNPAQFIRMVQQRVAELETKLNQHGASMSPQDRQTLIGQIQEAKRVQAAIFSRLAQQRPQGQQGQQSPANQPQPGPSTQVHASLVARPSPRPTPVPPQRPAGSFGSPVIQPGQAAPQMQGVPQHQNIRPSPQMNAANLTGVQGPGAGGMAMPTGTGMQNVPALRPEQFSRALVDLMKKRGTPIQSRPMLDGREVDLYRLYQVVQGHGGGEAAGRKGSWPAIAAALEFAPIGSPQSQHTGMALAQHYRNYLAPFEEVWLRAVQHQYQISSQQQAAAQTAGQGGQPGQGMMGAPQQPQAGAQQIAPPQRAPSQPQQPQQQQPQQQPQQAGPQGILGGQANATLGQGFVPQPVPQLSQEQLAKLNMTQERFAQMFIQQQYAQFLQRQQAAQQTAQQPQQQQNPMAQAPGQQQNVGMAVPSQQQHQQQQQQQQQQGHGAMGQDHQWNAAQMQMANGAASLSPQQQQQQQMAQGVPPRGPQQPQQQQQVPQARHIPVSKEKLEEARRAMANIDQELAVNRPRLTIIEQMDDEERRQTLAQVEKLAPIQETVNALLPAFYAMNGNLEPAKRIKIMAYMFKDQLDLLPQRQCILRLADLDKLKMQMSRCITFVRAQNPELTNHLLQQMQMQQGAGTARPPSAIPQQQQQQLMMMQQSELERRAQMQQQQQQQQQHDGTGQGQPAPGQQQLQQQQLGNAAPSDVNAQVAMHGIKRGLRMEDLKQPPMKRGKGPSRTASGASPNAAQDTSPEAAQSSGADYGPSPKLSVRSPANSKEQAQPPARGGKKAEKAMGSKGKASGKKAKAEGAAGKKFQTSADIMAEVKREMAAEAERKRKEGNAGSPEKVSGDATGGSDTKNAAPGAPSEEDKSRNEQLEAAAKRQREIEMAGRDPAGFVEAAWQELLASTTTSGSAAPGDFGVGATRNKQGSDSAALESLLSLLGQDGTGLIAPPSRLDSSATGSASASAQQLHAEEQPSAALDSAGVDLELDIDMFDFIDASAAGPDAFRDDAELEELNGLLGGPASIGAGTDEPPAETPELIASSRLPSLSSSGTSASSGPQNRNAHGGRPAGFGSGELTTSPADSSDEGEPSPSDALSLVPGTGKGPHLKNDDWWTGDHFAAVQNDRPWAIVQEQ